MINYSPAGQWALVVRALFINESLENPVAVGDGGQALGPGQQHPAFFIQWYGAAGPFNSDTWNDAFVRACAAYFTWAIPQFGLEGAVTAYNIGVSAYQKGGRNAVYLAGFMIEFRKLGGNPARVPRGTLARRALGAIARFLWDS